jgi:hypothetical protein
LTREGMTGAAADQAMAARRVFDKLHGLFAPLLGAAGLQAMFARSANLAQGDFAFLGPAAVETSAQLQQSLQAQAPEAASNAAVALFGTFFTLLTDFIGERLTSQVLSSAWPIVEAAASKESSDE